MTLQRPTNRALSIFAMRHLVAEGLKTKPQPTTKGTFALLLFQDEAGQTAHSFSDSSLIVRDQRAFRSVGRGVPMAMSKRAFSAGHE